MPEKKKKVIFPEKLLKIFIFSKNKLLYLEINYTLVNDERPLQTNTKSLILLI